MKKQIAWEPQFMEIDTATGHLRNPVDLDAIEEDQITDEEQMMMEKMGMMMMPDMKHVTATPFGMFDIDDAMHPLKQFKMWMAHTNFNISSEVRGIIEKTPGVEVLRVVSRYRFIIAIGELFNPQDVKFDIESRLCERPRFENDIKRIENPDIKQVVQVKINDYQESCVPGWAIFVFPNGQIESIDSSSKGFEETVEDYKEIESRTTGVLLTNV